MKEKRICAVCGREIAEDDFAVRYDGKPVHGECAEKVYAKCGGCGKWFPRGSVEETECESRCRRCMERDFVKCAECGSYVRRGEETMIDGDAFCDYCVENHYVQCEECHEYVRIDDANYVGSVDGYVCDSCLCDFFSRCEWCCEYYRNEDMRLTVSDEYVCSTCGQRHYHVCEDCGRMVHEDDVCCRNGSCYCEHCDPGDCEDGVMGYHGFDRSRYVERSADGGDRDEIYFGVELECEKGDFDESGFGRWMDDDCESPLVHFEHDGSLDDGGVEAITQPCTLRYHQEKLDWKRFCSALAGQGFASHNTRHCGLHVHISRDALRPTTIVKMDVFINRAKDFFSVIARRESFYGCGGEYDLAKKADTRKALEWGSHDCRYTAVNTTNPETVEIRIFRGTLRHDTILGTIEMLHGLIRFLGNVPFSRIYETEKNVFGFIDFLAENHETYPHVLPMMRRLFVRPRCERDDYAKKIGEWYGKFVERTADENEI